MNDGPYKLHTGYLVEGLELFIRKVAYTKYDATVLAPHSDRIICIKQLPSNENAVNIDRLYTITMSMVLGGSGTNATNDLMWSNIFEITCNVSY
jgi:hypothetical protein